MNVLAVITLFLVCFGMICAMAMVYAGFIGLLDWESLAPPTRRGQWLLILDLLCLSGLIWVINSIQCNWRRNDDARRAIYTGSCIGAISVSPAVVAILVSRILP